VRRDFRDYLESKPAELDPTAYEYLHGNLKEKIQRKFPQYYEKIKRLEETPKTNQIDWKELYKHYFFGPNLNGIWLAYYSTHGLEIIAVEQKGYFVKGTKIKGDENVPSGEPTFQVILNEDLKFGIGKIRLAWKGYKNPWWGFCVIDFQNCLHNQQFRKLWFDSSFVSKSLFWKSPIQTLTLSNVNPLLLAELCLTCPVPKDKADGICHLTNNDNDIDDIA